MCGRINILFKFRVFRGELADSNFVADDESGVGRGRHLDAVEIHGRVATPLISIELNSLSHDSSTDSRRKDGDLKPLITWK